MSVLLIVCVSRSQECVCLPGCACLCQCVCHSQFVCLTMFVSLPLMTDAPGALSPNAKSPGMGI